jgi:hypothetical protein
MKTLNLNKTGQALLDGSGNGTYVDGPSFYGEQWDITSTAVLASSAANPTAAIPQVQLFVGGAYMDGTYTGSNNNSDTKYTAHAGQQIILTFIGGQPNDRVTVTFLGTRTLP